MTTSLKSLGRRTEADQRVQHGEFCVDRGRNHKAGCPGLQEKGFRGVEGILSLLSLVPLPLVILSCLRCPLELV